MARKREIEERQKYGRDIYAALDVLVELRACIPPFEVMQKSSPVSLAVGEGLGKLLCDHANSRYVKEDAHAWDPTCTISYPSHRPLNACLVWATKEIEVLITHECFQQQYGSCHIEHYVAASAHQLYHCGRYAEANPKSIVVVDLDLLSHTDFHRVALLYTLPLAEALGANRKCAIMYFLDSYVRISTRCLASRRETKVLMQSILHSKTGGLECCICMQGTYCG